MKEKIDLPQNKRKRNVVKWIIICFLLYILIGAIAPFCVYKPIRQETIDELSHDDIFDTDGSPDRAMLIETNAGALDERIRLMNLAEERIVISTFDFKDGESGRDLASVLLQKADEGVQVYIYVDGLNGQLRMNGKDLS